MIWTDELIPFDLILFHLNCSMTSIHQQHQPAVVRYIIHLATVHQVHLLREYSFLRHVKSLSTIIKYFLSFRSPRSLSPAHQTDGYDDIDDYSPVVSDIEDPNDDEMDSKAKSKRKDDLDNNDILQKILNEQSSSKCELEEGNVSDQGEHDEADETKESTCVLD